ERGTSRLEMGYEYARISGTDVRQTVLFELTHGLLNNLDFEVEVPTVFVDRSNNSQAGLGDLRLKSKIRFLKGREANPLSLSGQLVIKFPTCDRDKVDISFLNPACTGETDVGLVGIASKTFSPLTVHLNLGYTFVGNPPNKTLDDVFSYDLAFEYDTSLQGLTLMIELMGEMNQNIQYSGQDPLAFLYGATYEVVPNLKVDGAFSAGFTEGSPDYTFTVGLAYYF
ncbi:MAG: transporter, partial [Nitrospira sp.]|nr:transporter [Nitrospira sp.]